MATPTTHTRQLGPEHAGVELTHEEYERAQYAPGHRYELVAGRLCVSPAPDFQHDFVQSRLLLGCFARYAATRPDLVKHVSARARVITRGPTDVEPDLALYTDVPGDRRAHWRELHPVLVVEVVSASDAAKDLVRNREVYATVPSVREYWIVDPRHDPTRPTLIALVRGGAGWVERVVPPGEVHRSPTLPGLEVDLVALLA